MPAVFLDRLPLPSLQAYTIGSVVLLACSVHYAVQVTSEFGLNAAFGHDGIEYTTVKYANSSLGMHSDVSDRDILGFEGLMKRTVEVVCFMLQEPLCIWTLINMAYCCFILVGKMIQRLVFGELRVAEQQHIKDKFWNFVFYKFIFIFGVMNVQFLDEVVLWCGWFSILGFLHLLAQLCKDRCEYLSFSPATPKWTHYRVMALLCGILMVSFALFGVCIFVGVHTGINTFAFMFAECSLVSVRTLYVIIRYAIYLRDVNHNGVWEKRASYAYYTELLFELTALTIDFLHHLHMLVWGNIFLSMASLVIAMQLRCLFYEIRHRIKKYKNYLRIVKHMEFNYPMATPEQLEKNNDACAICWDHLDAARKLPCGHLFHNSCLRSWLEQDTSCPTCRQALSDSIEKDKSANLSEINPIILDDTAVHAVNQTTNHFFHFDGSRYISWLPSFSVEVTHPNMTGDRQFAPVQTSQLDSMARQVHQMFPHFPLSVIMDDLRVSKSVEVTIESILDEKLVPPPHIFQGSKAQTTQTSSETPSQVSSYSTASLRSLRRELNHMPSSHEGVHHESLLTEDPSCTNDKSSFLGTGCICPTSKAALGCRFSKSPKERQRILAKRKEDLLKTARRRYMMRFQGGGVTDEYCS